MQVHERKTYNLGKIVWRRYNFKPITMRNFIFFRLLSRYPQQALNKLTLLCISQMNIGLVLRIWWHLPGEKISKLLRDFWKDPNTKHFSLLRNLWIMKDQQALWTEHRFEFHHGDNKYDMWIYSSRCIVPESDGNDADESNPKRITLHRCTDATPNLSEESQNQTLQHLAYAFCLQQWTWLVHLWQSDTLLE